MGKSIAKAKRAASTGARRSARTFEEAISLRRWEAAHTDRLNEGHWYGAHGRTVNEDLFDSLETLRNRCDYEISRNPNVAGVIHTHTVAMLGATGPTLHVETADTAYERDAEAVWAAWWERPDVNGVLSGFEILGQNIGRLWGCGEFLTQLTTKGADLDEEGDEPAEVIRRKLAFRLRCIDPRRLGTGNAARLGDYSATVLGVERNTTGKPTRYFIDNTPANQAALMSMGPPLEIAARDLVHGLVKQEEDQVKGVPWRACSLHSPAALRDFDTQVLDAARAAADFGVVLWTPNPDIPGRLVNDSMDVKRRRVVTAPPGYQATQLTPQQPSTQYREYRNSRLAELGRPVDMPGMMVLLDSGEHNFSSARFDAQLFNRGLGFLQALIVAWSLERYRRRLFTEARIARLIGATPKDAKFVWRWPPPPEVTPIDDARTWTERLRNGTATLKIANAYYGEDSEAVAAQRQKENLPAPSVAQGAAPQPDNNDKGNADEKAPKPAKGLRIHA